MDGTPAVLLIEDEPLLADSLRYSLERAGMVVALARDAETAISRFHARRPGAAIVDLGLPQHAGLDVCRVLCGNVDGPGIPVLVLWPSSRHVDRATAVRIGATGSMEKPFSMARLLAWLRAEVQYDWLLPPEEFLVAGSVELDVAAHEMRVAGRYVGLTRKEFMLLEALLRHKGRILGREFLMNVVWGPDYFGETNTLDVHIRRLRRKLAADPRAPSLLTERGRGYRLAEEPRSSVPAGARAGLV